VTLYRCKDTNCSLCDYDESSNGSNLCTECISGYDLQSDKSCLKTPDKGVLETANAVLGGSVATIALSALKGPDMFASFNFL